MILTAHINWLNANAHAQKRLNVNAVQEGIVTRNLSTQSDYYYYYVLYRGAAFHAP